MLAQELEKITCQSCQIVETTAGFIQAQLGQVAHQAIEEKGLNSLVSYVDKEAEKQLVEGFRQLLPNSTFLTEEETVASEQGTYRWIIDPLDGTTNFLHQVPCFAISVALQEEGQTILGIVYEVNRRECFYAWKDGGAYLNGQAIHVTKTTELKDALLATGFPYFNFEHLEAYFKVFQHFLLHTRGIRRWGAAAVDLAYVACGRFDAFFEYSLNPWDVAAGAFLVQEAGGKVADFKGGTNYLYGKEMVAGNALLFDEVSKIVKDGFYPM